MDYTVAEAARAVAGGMWNPPANIHAWLDAIRARTPSARRRLASLTAPATPTTSEGSHLVAKSPNASTPDQLNRLLVTGVAHSRLCTMRAAVHLLTYTALCRATPASTSSSSSSTLRDAPTVRYLGAADQCLLALAVSLTTGQPVDLRQNLIGFPGPYARRVIEAVAIATDSAGLDNLAATATSG